MLASLDNNGNGEHSYICHPCGTFTIELIYIIQVSRIFQDKLGMHMVYKMYQYNCSNVPNIKAA